MANNFNLYGEGIKNGWDVVDAALLEDDRTLEALRARLFTAHQMGGCAMGEDPSRSVVNSWGEHHHLSNLSVHDASIFPTSLGANPQLTVYALAARNSHRLAGRLQSNA